MRQYLNNFNSLIILQCMSMPQFVYQFISYPLITWAVSTFWLSWIILLWRFLYEILFEHTLSVFLGTQKQNYYVMKWLPILLFKNYQNVLHYCLTILSSDWQCGRLPASLHPLQQWLLSILFIIIAVHIVTTVLLLLLPSCWA
jgi:hypothetical protein